MVDDYGIIHMNGRIYDARIGRFLQADPFIQAASNTQSYNRYSYVMNNPLNVTDPSGYFSLRQFVGVIVAVALCVYAQCSGSTEALTWAGIGAAAGAAQAAADGGNILLGAITGFFSGGLGGMGGWGGFLAGATLGGATSYMMGGKFGHGFISAGISSLVPASGNFMADLAIKSVVGGTISELTGGKFANGASSAAVAFLIQQGGQRIGAGGDTPKPVGDEVGEVYGHGVWGVGKHGSVRFYPDDPNAMSAYLKENNISQVLQVDQAGRQYIVFSGGPDYNGSGLLGNLRGDINRDSDLANAPNDLVGKVYAPAGVSKDAFIKQLISNTSTYNANPVNYDLLPSLSVGYNSNSYFRGLVNSAGGTIQGNISWQYQGFSKPVPIYRF